MNERIRELAQQVEKWISGTDIEGMPEDEMTYDEIFNKKFAELLIQDTISKIESVGWKSSNDVPFEITDLFVRQIKSHFGVK